MATGSPISGWGAVKRFSTMTAHEPGAMPYLKPSIHSVSACAPRLSAASMAALYPRRAWSLDMTPLVTGFT